MTSRLLTVSCIALCIVILMTSSVSARSKRSKKYKVLTFNTALVDFTDLSDPAVTETRTARRDALINALTDSPADIVCLQETYFGSDVEAIVKGLGGKYPHSLSTLHRNGVLPPQTNVAHDPMCTSNLTNFGSCLVIQNCTTLTDFAAFLQCAGTRCFSEYTTDVLSGGQNCLSCVNLNLPDLAKVSARCTNIDGNANNVNLNSAGVVLLSKRPLEDTKVVKYYGGVVNLFDRSYLQAKVDNKLTVVCTHLSSISPPFFEPFISANLSSYEEANIFESTTLTQNFQNDPKVVLLGDFNNALNFTPSLDIRVPAAYNILDSNFNTNPLLVCSICSAEGGPFNSFRKFSTSNGAIEHVFGGKYVTVCQPERVLTEPFSFMNMQISLSDHFGVMAKVKLSCKSRRGKNKKKHHN